MAVTVSKLLEEVATRWRLPGAVMVEFSPSAAETFCVGARDREAGLDMTPETVFPIASVTKTFTAEMVLASLEGKLDLRLCELVPAVSFHDKAASEKMTLRDALCHRTGLPPHTWAWVFGDCNRKTFFEKRFPHLLPVQAFDKGYRYSNLIYGLLGHLLDVQLGQSWETLLNKTVFEALELDHTGFLDQHWASSSPDLAQPYRDDFERIPHFAASRNHPIAAASELMSSMTDLARWGQHLLTLPGDRNAWKPQTLISKTRWHHDFSPLHYGLGWRIETFQGKQHVWHTGQCSGYTTMLSLFPEQRRGFALACNRSSSTKALYHLVYGSMDDRSRNWSETFSPPAATSRSDIIEAEREDAMPDLAPGLFHHPGYGDFALLRRSGNWYGKFQNSTPTPIRWSSSTKGSWELPIYKVRFPLDTRRDQIAIPFEPALPPICFHRV